MPISELVLLRAVEVSRRFRHPRLARTRQHSDHTPAGNVRRGYLTANRVRYNNGRGRPAANPADWRWRPGPALQLACVDRRGHLAGRLPGPRPGGAAVVRLRFRP